MFSNNIRTKQTPYRNIVKPYEAENVCLEQNTTLYMKML